MKGRLENITAKLPAAAALCLFVFIWWAVSGSGAIPSYMLPSPQAVAGAFVGDFPTLMLHAWVSLQEALLGLAIGVAFAFALSVAMERFRVLDEALSPLIVISQTIPTIAIAPLLVLWMGFGKAPKVTLVVLTTFFPIAVGLLDGYRRADPDAVFLLKTMGAGRAQIFFHVRLPAALPHFFSGLKISASYAVVGAVVAEWLGGFDGLGVYMTRVRKAYAFDKMFAVILLIVIISLLLMAAVDLIRRLSMPYLAVRHEA